jgi:plastocyanin/methionine-rich copper-binding protein CopC
MNSGKEDDEMDKQRIRKHINLFVLILLVATALMAGCTGSDVAIDEDEAVNEIADDSAPDMSEESTDDPEVEFTFETPVKSPHYVDNVPAHAAVIPDVPINIVVNFDFDVIPPSEIVVTGQDSQVYSFGDTAIDDNKLGMRVMMDPESPDGKYQVDYKACWPDGSCHDGMFQFAIDRTLASAFTDLRGQSEITVNMENNSFELQDIIIDAGTTLTWINSDSVDHYINTDPHPGHNYYPDQNSRALAGGETYSITLNTPGYYPYHCSAHPETMKAVIIVR